MAELKIPMLVKPNPLDLDDDDLAGLIADYVLAEVEKHGGESAVLHFDMDGSGPWCSWCGALGGLCPHLATSRWSKDDAEQPGVSADAV